LQTEYKEDFEAIFYCNYRSISGARAILQANLPFKRTAIDMHKILFPRKMSFWGLKSVINSFY